MTYRKNSNLFVTDTETANSVLQPLPYDIGYKISDRKGNTLVRRSFLVTEIYCNCRDLMKTAYYADKLPQYEEEVKRGERVIASIHTIRKTIMEDMKNYNTNIVYAYNMNFDKKALNNDIRYITKSKYRYFFPYKTEFRCIWHMACQLLLARSSFIKFAINNNYISPKGNILTNAEVCYRYITGNTQFMEEHKGIDDVDIETEILFACLRQHKKMNTAPYSACWRLVQKKRSEMEKVG